MLNYIAYNLSVQRSQLGLNRALLKMLDNIVPYIEVRRYYPSYICIYNYSGPKFFRVPRVYLLVPSLVLRNFENCDLKCQFRKMSSVKSS